MKGGLPSFKGSLNEKRCYAIEKKPLSLQLHIPNTARTRNCCKRGAPPPNEKNGGAVNLGSKGLVQGDEGGKRGKRGVEEDRGGAVFWGGKSRTSRKA